MKKQACLKFFENKIKFLSERLIFAQEMVHIFYPFYTSHWRMFDIVREKGQFV